MVEHSEESFDWEGHKEAGEAKFEEAVKKVTSDGYRFHQQEHDKEGKDPKTYHTSEHPRALAERAKSMAEVLHLSSKQCAVTEMAIAWHDTIIDYDKAEPNNMLAMIRRHRGAREGDKPKGSEGNEGKSGRLLEQEMNKINELNNNNIFSGGEIQTARWAIEATYPDVNFGPDFKGAVFEEYPYYDTAINKNPDLAALLNELKTQGITRGPLFFQPHLEQPLETKEELPREVLVVALADLAAAGCVEPEVFFKEGDDEMRELYANLRRPEVMSSLIEGEEVSRVDREKVTTAFWGWLDSQPGFVVWQALRFEKILCLLKERDLITSEEEQGLRAQFSHFAENIRATRDRARELKSKFEEIKSTHGEKDAFSYLVKSLHYEM